MLRKVGSIAGLVVKVTLDATSVYFTNKEVFSVYNLHTRKLLHATEYAAGDDMWKIFTAQLRSGKIGDVACQNIAT